MAGGEHQAQQVVADVVVERRLQVRPRLVLQGLELAAQFLVLAVQHLATAHHVDGAATGDRHQPCARIVGHARVGPPFQRRHQCILGQLFGDADIAHDPRQPGDQPGLLDPPDGADRAMDVSRRH